MNPTNPGYKTTEFWVTTVVGIVTLAGSLGFITADQANTVTTAVSQIISGVVAIATVVQYIRGRSTVKAAAIAAGIGKPQ